MSPLRRFLVRAFIGAHTALYSLTAGRIGGRMGAQRILLLTTTGRRSGAQRTVPLVYFEDGERLVLIASNGGASSDPQWWKNLQQRPEALVQVGAETRRMRARICSVEERARLWPRVKRENPPYAEYEKKTTREIPVVLLAP
ncbi:MAG: nitroreductase family deazaflavin-dependent oxidoreductase [Myxococcota bacterium]